jgi:hypothetical protein
LMTIQMPTSILMIDYFDAPISAPWMLSRFKVLKL